MSQILPEPKERRDLELKRLLAGMEQFMTDAPPGVFIPEVLHPADKRKNMEMSEAAKLK